MIQPKSPFTNSHLLTRSDRQLPEKFQKGYSSFACINYFQYHTLKKKLLSRIFCQLLKLAEYP